MLATAPGAQQGRQQRIQHSIEIDAKMKIFMFSGSRAGRFRKPPKIVLVGKTLLMFGEILLTPSNTLVMAGTPFLLLAILFWPLAIVF